MITYHLSLDYDLKAGWLAPFVAGLTRGEAMARACTDCGRVSFPPLRTCLCGSRRAEWVRLSARARVVTQTLGPDGAFALVQFEGADGLATCAIDAIAEASDAQTPEDAAAGATAFTGSLRLIASDPQRLVLGQET